MFEETSSSTHPPLPPTTEDDRISWLRLLRSRRVGPTTFHRLIGEHGSAQAALAALPEVARAAGDMDYAPCPPAVARAELAAAQAAGARMICFGEPDYPSRLAAIADPPPILWAIGDAAVLGRPMVAIVGARNASSLGLRMARSLAGGLAEAGIVVVSGLARGVDAAAHHAALEGGTIAVMAGGVDVIYPQENARLGQDIPRRGLRLSEAPMGKAAQARHFPSRNRIVSGLSLAVVVIEAACKSGSLITARGALEQGRDVMAVPGHPFDARAAGCNMLIRDGALLVRSAADVLEALPRVTGAQAAGHQPSQHRAGQRPYGTPAPARTADASVATPAPPDARRSAAGATAGKPLATLAGLAAGMVRGSDRRSLRETARLHQQILDRLGPSPLGEDQLIRDLQVPAAAVGPALTELELEGRICRQPGGLLARNA